MNEDKSHWDPMQEGEWLGFVINTITMSFHIPERKVEKLKRLLGSAIGQDHRLDNLCSLGSGTHFTSSNQANVPGN